MRRPDTTHVVYIRQGSSCFELFVLAILVLGCLLFCSGLLNPVFDAFKEASERQQRNNPQPANQGFLTKEEHERQQLEKIKKDGQPQR